MIVVPISSDPGLEIQVGVFYLVQDTYKKGGISDIPGNAGSSLIQARAKGRDSFYLRILRIFSTFIFFFHTLIIFPNEVCTPWEVLQPSG